MIRFPTPIAIRDALRRVPTADLYVINPLRHLRRSDPTTQLLHILAPNLYRIGRVGVVVRYGGVSDIGRLRTDGAKRIVYVADDDFAAGSADPHLPLHYREWLKAFAQGAWPTLKDAADIVVVPGAVLAEQYGAKALIMPPAWHRLPASLEHFPSSRIDIAHLGTGSHNADFEPLAVVLSEVLRKHPQARLTLFSIAVPHALRGSSQVRLRRPMAWWRYRLTLPRMRFHLALYPLRDSPFNRARSANKFFEHALVGAASLMSPNAALVEAAGSGVDVFVHGDIADWKQRIEADLADPGAMRQRAEEVRAHIIANDPLDQAADTWRKVLASD